MNNIVCNNCGYDWETKSKMRLVTCPSCLHKVKNFINFTNNEESAKNNKDRNSDKQMVSKEF